MQEKISDGWDGTDRRSIPIHVLTHVSEVMDKFRQEENDRHVRIDEEQRERFELISDRFESLERKIHHLTDSITSFMGKTEILFNAFPGQDPEGHRKAHEAWLAEVRERKEFYSMLKKELAKYGLLGLVSWLLFLAWNGILKGPQQ